ncbi:LysR family transcriptional regulator [Rhodococcoides yunnanense]|uniref:LysR family transcriptional regulator n=1 Tax=Rhodococcoides yunnanense TaxID=278209 RepID=A0ABU4B9V5_9NOCA|nr:LysR family transcriptional regulator [Rhodococcus yunnanensis]MDV6260983.1 LysR family transcriptional regulator [Rhodococcus yunnanensis]
MNVTTSMLECFVAIVDEHGLGNAARALGVSQPTVSGTVRTLETELGVELFRREANTLVLSPEGAALLPLARRTVLDHRAVERVVDELRTTHPGGAVPTVRIALSDRPVTPELMAAFVAAQPGSRIDVVSISDPAEALTQVRMGQIDCAVVPDSYASSDLVHEYLPDDVLVLALPPGSGCVDTLDQLDAAVPLAVLAPTHRVGVGVVDVLAGFGVVATVVLSGVSQQALPALVAHGIGAAVMAESMARSVTAAGGAIVPWPVPTSERTMLVYSSNWVAPLINSFIDQLVRGRSVGAKTNHP